MVELNPEQKVIGFQEKPGPGEARSSLANTDIYLLEPEVLDYVSRDTFFHFADNSFPRFLKAAQKVVGYEGDFYGSDIRGS